MVTICSSSSSNDGSGEADAAGAEPSSSNSSWSVSKSFAVGSTLSCLVSDERLYSRLGCCSFVAVFIISCVGRDECLQVGLCC